jgi:hypothetical protein
MSKSEENIVGYTKSAMELREKNKKWSGDLEVKYMQENLLRPKNGRNKGQYRTVYPKGER